MAKENATINLYVNNDQAKAAVAELSKTYNDLKKAREAAQKAGDVDKALELQAQELTARKKLEEANSSHFSTELALANLSKINTSQLITAKRKLRRELNLINRDTEEYKDKLGALNKVEAELAKTQGRRVGIMSKLTPVVSVDRVASKLVGEVSQAVDAYARYDDKLADVMKTTGLAKSETVALSESLAKIDTRSSQMELLDLASQAGKLGLSAAADVEKFTIAADKIGVALGDDLGDKEAAINSMGKLSDLFKLKDQYGMGDAMLKVGSAVNALGAASTANEGYIVDFTSKIAGIASSANISAANVTAIGAAFSALSQPMEASATVVNKVLLGMHTKTSEYAKVARMELKDFSELLNTDANEALLRVLEGMKGADLGETAQMLGEVGENGANAATAVATISQKIGFLREQQELARVEFEKGTAVVYEFNTKNNTAQALREKQKKAAQAALVELGEKLQPIVDMFYAGSIRGMKALKELIGVIYEYKGIIIAVAAALGLYLVAQKLHTNWSRLQAYWSGITSKAILTETSSLAAASLGTKALAAAKMLLTGQFRAAAVAAKSFFVALGPVGWAVTAITGLVTVMGLLKGSTNEVSGVYSEFGIALRREDNTFKDLKQRLRETAEGTTERADLIKLINELYGTYLPRLLLEKSTTEEIATALDNATVAMKRNIAEKIRASETEKAEQGLYEAKKQAVNTLLESYAESGDRTAGQMALAAQRFSAAIDLIDKTPTTGTERVAAVNTLLSAMGEKLVRSTATIHAAQISLFRRGGPIAQAADALGDYAASYEQYIKSTRTLSALFPNSSEKKKKEQIVVDKACSKCGKTPCECYKSNAESRQAWTLENDTRFAAESIALKRRLLNGEFSQEDDYAKELLALEITTLQSRIAANRDKGADLAKIKEQLLDKQIQQAQAARKREDDLSKIARGGDTELQKAQREHAELLREKGLNADRVATMTATEKAAYLQIEKEYAAKISGINLKTLQDNLSEQKKALDKKLTTIRLAAADELAAADSLAKKKVLLERWFSTEELREVSSTKEADKLLKAKYAEDEQAATKAELTEILKTHLAMAAEIEATGGLMGGTVKFTEQDVAKLQEIIANLRAELAKFGQDPIRTSESAKVDILGMTADEWTTFFQNTENGRTSLEKIEIAAKAIGDAFADVSKLMASIEQRDLKNYEKSQDKKKKSLDRQLKSGVISQDAYSSKVQALDEQTEAKRVELERKQAERQKALAIFNAIVSTAVAIVKAFEAGPIAGPILAGVIGALGAVQIATIIAQPLPGKEEGGWIDVVREQDGKPFRAKNDPTKRGAVNSPTVIVGEAGTEYVVHADGYANPTVRPVLNAIEEARINGQLKTLNLNAVMQTHTMPGRAQGGYVEPKAISQNPPLPSSSVQDSEMASVLTRIVQVTERLNDRLNSPISAQVVMTGEKGLAKQYDKYNKIRDNATIGRR